MRYVLRFANGEENRSTREWLFETQRRSEFPLTPNAEAGRAQFSADLTTEKITATRATLRSMLASIRDDKRQSLERSEELLRRVWPLPVLRRKPNQHLALCWIITDADAFNAFVAVLLLDKERPYGRDLCCCKLDTCARFFLAEKSATGLSRRRYHDEGCMKEFHKRGSYERVKASRKNRAKKARKR